MEILIVGLVLLTLIVQLALISYLKSHSDQHQNLERLIGYQRNYEAGILELGKVPAATMSFGTSNAIVPEKEK